MPPILSVTIFLPIVTALYITSFIGSDDSAENRNHIKYISIFSVILSLLLGAFLLMNFNSSYSGFQFVEKIHWVKALNIDYHVGIDGISMLFIILTILLTSICIISSLYVKIKNINEYIICLLLIEALTIGFFCSINLLLFYIFFEALLIPMYFIIGVWGGENKIYAAIKFFLYTFFGSVIFLLAIIFINNTTHTLDINLLKVRILLIDPEILKILWLGIFIAFAVKVPMVPFHTWLPDAHVEAPTAGSVILAGVLLKVGGYGMLRILIFIFGETSAFFAPYVITLSAVAIIYASLVALAQDNMKKVVAYSSVAHMGYVTAGIFSGTKIGIEGAIFQMLSHGIISAGLFLVVGSLYERHHTKNINAYGSVASFMPILASIFMIYVLGSIGLPGTSGFIGEFLSLIGVFEHFAYHAIFVASGLILGAIYMLKLYKFVMLGDVKNAAIPNFKDLSNVEIICMLPLACLVIYIGIYPYAVLQFINL